MVRTAIAEEQDVRDLMLTEKIIEEHRPVAKTSAEVRGLLRPVDPIACADVDPLDLHSTLPHRDREVVEEGSWRALQEQERPSLRLVDRHARTLRQLARRADTWIEQ